MRILFIVRTLAYGGASKQLALIAEGLSKRGYEVFVYTYNSDYTTQNLSKTFFLPEKKVLNSTLKEYIFSPLRIRKQIKKVRPDIVVSWRANAGCFCTIASLFTGVKHVFSERTDPYMETSFALKIATKFCDFADYGVFQTKEAQNYYKRLRNGRSIVIYNPIFIKNDISLIQYDNRKNEISFVGRFFLKQKRQDIILKAFKIVLETYPKMLLVFYGDGDDMERVKKLTIDMGLQNNVVFAGVVNNILECIAKSQLLVLSSDYEGIPNVLLEAMSVGVPVISTDASPGGVRLLIKDGTNGFIVPRGDYEKLAEKIVQLIADPLLAETFIKNGFENIKKFDPNTIFDNWDKFLKGL